MRGAEREKKRERERKREGVREFFDVGLEKEIGAARLLDPGLLLFSGFRACELTEI